MYNPKTGKNEDYVEVWRRYPNVAGGDYCVLELIDPSGNVAFLGRVGGLALGLGKRIDGTFEAYREDWDGPSRNRVYEDSNGVSLPSLPAILPEEYVEGADVPLGGRSWVVRTIGKLS